MKGPIKPSLIPQREITIYTFSILLKGTSKGLQKCPATSPFPIFLVCDWDLNPKPPDPPSPVTCRLSSWGLFDLQERPLKLGCGGWGESARQLKVSDMFLFIGFPLFRPPSPLQVLQIKHVCSVRRRVFH